MDSLTNKKRLKIIWLCHFANKSIKDYFNTPHVYEMAPWISNLIELFKERPEIELHILAPNVFTNCDCSFIKEGVNYHFYKHLPIPSNLKFFKKIHNFLRIDNRTNFYWVKQKIVSNINKINPDIIHLHGAENPYYSAGILPLFNKYPVLTTIQGFIRNASHTNFSIKKKIIIEESILKKSKHIGVRTKEMSQIALQLNPNANLHFHNYPLSFPSKIKENIGKVEPIDCIFFARVCKDKGIEDLLIAISIVKKESPNISLTVIGDISNDYLSHLIKMCAELDIEKNIKFIGFLPTQEDIYKYALQSKICILPTYHDIIPGTIIESMFIKLPVIAYAVGGIPELNENEETIILVEKLNITKLAENILNLINNKEKRIVLSEKAYNYAMHRFNNENIVLDILNAYKLVL